MNQAGTRSWGSMEPTTKRYHSGQYSVTPQVPTMQRWQPPPSSNFPPPPPHPSQLWSQQQSHQFGQGYEQQPQYNINAGDFNQQAMAAMSGVVHIHSQQQQQQWVGSTNYPNLSVPLPQQQQINVYRPNLGLPPNCTQPNAHQSGFAFNQHGQHYQQQQAQNNLAFNRSGMHQQQQQQQQPEQPQTGGRANLTNLRAQLMSTLQKQKRGD